MSWLKTARETNSTRSDAITPMFTSVLLLFFTLLFLLLAAFLLGVEPAKTPAVCGWGSSCHLASSRGGGILKGKMKCLINLLSVHVCRIALTNGNGERALFALQHCSFDQVKSPEHQQSHALRSRLDQALQMLESRSKAKGTLQEEQKLVSNALVRDHNA